MRVLIIGLVAFGCASPKPTEAPRKPPKTAAEIAALRDAADRLNQAGDDAYSRAEFERAIEAFRRAYALDDEAASEAPRRARYFYKLAETYRQIGKCHDAVFFLKRYLWLMTDELGPDARREVESKIDEQEECVRSRSRWRKPPELLGHQR